MAARMVGKLLPGCGMTAPFARKIAQIVESGVLSGLADAHVTWNFRTASEQLIHAKMILCMSHGRHGFVMYDFARHSVARMERRAMRDRRCNRATGASF